MTRGRRGPGEGSIYRRQNGLWVGSVDLGLIDGKRKRRWVYGQSQGEVRDKLRSLQRVVASGAMPAPANLTVGRFLDTWLHEFLPGTVSPRTEDIYANIVRTYLVPTVGSTKLGKLTPADVSRMLASLERCGYAPETRRKARAVLRRALRRAEQEGIVSRNVAAIADGPKVPHREGRTLTPDQAKTFLGAVKGNRLEAAYVVALALGLRRGELLASPGPTSSSTARCPWCGSGASSCAIKDRGCCSQSSRQRGAGARCTCPSPWSRPSGHTVPVRRKSA